MLFFSFLLNAQNKNMVFERVFDETLSQASYIIANNKGEAIIIDPKRDIDTYIKFAKDNNLIIKYVTETHIHADYLSGAQELAHATGADLLLSNEGGDDWQYEFDHLPLKDKQVIDLGNVELKVMHTPGHTPESLTFLVKDKSQKYEDLKAITGDFIFVGDVGRPDLLEKSAGQVGSQFTGAHQLFESLNEFIKLPKNTEIWPGHGAGSFCGKSLSTISQSTLEAEIATNPAFKLLNDKDAFTAFILDGQPQPPKYFGVMKQWNKQMRPLAIEVQKIPQLTKKEVLEAIDNNVLIIDTRKKDEVAKGFIPGSFTIEDGKSFSTFVGSLVDYKNQVILVTDEKNVNDLTRKLMRIGFDNIYGYIPNISDFNNLKTSKIINSDSLVKKIKEPKGKQFIDVRTVAEYKDGHIKGFENIPLNDLAANKDKISKTEPVYIHCQSGVRAAIAYSILEQLGFDNIINYSGSINDWIAKKLPLVR